MAVTSNSMVLPQTIRRTAALCTAAKTTYADGTNAVLLAAGGSNGSVVRRLTAIPLATVTATQLQLFGYDGTSYRLLNTALMPAYTMATTTADALTDFNYSDNNTLYLPSGWTLYVGIAVALSSGILFSLELGDF